MLELLVAVLLAQPDPTITVTSDNTRIDKSCIVQIEPNTVIADADGDGVIQIAADGITVEFAKGSTLRGSPAGAAPDTYKGVGIRLSGHKNVTLKNARVSGFKVGIQADTCPSLTIAGAELNDNYRQHLKSTAQAEDGADWLFPHENDKDQWMTQHGAALAVKNADHVTLRDITVRNSQNGIILDRVSDSAVYDNDCSFLSGWGLAMWRSSGNIIAHNALDFCIRGYSHGVYNRGQDSAGLLMFEQNSRNTIAENSCSHGGDGIFGFAGREAIGQSPAPTPDFDYKRRGNSDNIIIANDLSYAAAHGLEMTFCAGNRILLNRFVENAICGIWGGYSNDNLIAENYFEANGQMGYGLERGGINIEHGSGHIIVGNTFVKNACGVHLWWNNNQGLLKFPGVALNDRGVTGNVIADNSFTGDSLALQLRDEPGAAKVKDNTWARNNLKDVKQETALSPGIDLKTSGDSPLYSIAQLKLPGSNRPVGARKPLMGRQNIIMTEWGPWDHDSPLARLIGTRGGGHTYEFHRIPATGVSVAGVGLHTEFSPQVEGKPWTATVLAAAPGVYPYVVSVNQPSYTRVLPGCLVSTSWDLIVFPWTAPPETKTPSDPARWTADARGPKAAQAKVSELRFAFGMRGPSDVNISPEITAAGLAPDHFGLIATTKIALPAGKWRVRTLSDDGIRVLADGQPIIDNWTWHGAETNTAELDGGRTVEFRVEYFEIDGAAVLEVSLGPAAP
jgi:parallel beta-helix repeat protein